MRFLLACLLSAASASAIDVEREEYKIIGWNDACSVAVEHYAYPKLGQAIYGEPITSRVGTLGIAASKQSVETRWVLETDGARSYDKAAVAAVRKKLRRAGYDRPGFNEAIRAAADGAPSGSFEVILSTAILDARPDSWIDSREWRWGWTHYNPLSTCALLVYEKIGERDRFEFLLTRIYNASARSDRGRAHATSGRMLFNDGDLVGALAEAAIGARMAPEVGGTRYQYAAMLALSGDIDGAMRELRAAAGIDRRYAEKAAKDVDFDALRPRQDFQDLLKRKRG